MSALDTPLETNLTTLVDGLVARGYPRSLLTKSLVKYLAGAATGLTGSTVSELTSSLAKLLARVENALDGGSVSELTSSISALAAGAAGASYRASAVHFANDTGEGVPASVLLTCAALTCPENGLFSFSCWFKITATAVAFRPQAIWGFDPFTYLELGGTEGFLDFDLGNDPKFYELRAESGISRGVWVHLMGSFNTNHGAGAKVGVFYLNDVLFSPDATDGDTAFVPLTNGRSLEIGAESGDHGFGGDMADVWIAPGVSLLSGNTIPVATRRRFINAAGKPVNPNGFPAGAVLLSGTASTFGTNQGSGGTFALTGSLTNASTSPSDYQARAVHFANVDGNPASVFLTCASLACAENGYLSFSGWFKITTSSGSQTPWLSSVDDYVNYLQIGGADGAFDWDAGGAARSPGPGAKQFDQAAAGGVTRGAWIHLLGSIDTNHASGAKIGAVYLNDAVFATTKTDTDPTFVPLLNGKNFIIGDDTFGSALIGDVADLWIAPGVSLLSGSTIPAATRRLFINSLGKPVNPNGFPAGAVLLSGTASNFATNQGSGGAFVLTGSLTDALTSPST